MQRVVDENVLIISKESTNKKKRFGVQYTTIDWLFTLFLERICEWKYGNKIFF